MTGNEYQNTVLFRFPYHIRIRKICSGTQYIEKLTNRFPNGFDPERSVHRATDDI